MFVFLLLNGSHMVFIPELKLAKILNQKLQGARQLGVIISQVDQLFPNVLHTCCKKLQLPAP